MKSSSEIRDMIFDVGSVSLSDLAVRVLTESDPSDANMLQLELHDLNEELSELNSKGFIEIKGAQSSFEGFIDGIKSLEIEVENADQEPSSILKNVYEFLNNNPEFDKTEVNVTAMGFLETRRIK